MKSKAIINWISSNAYPSHVEEVQGGQTLYWLREQADLGAKTGAETELLQTTWHLEKHLHKYLRRSCSNEVLLDVMTAVGKNAVSGKDASWENDVA